MLRYRYFTIGSYSSKLQLRVLLAAAGDSDALGPGGAVGKVRSYRYR